MGHTLTTRSPRGQGRFPLTPYFRTPIKVNPLLLECGQYNDIVQILPETPNRYSQLLPSRPED